MGKLESFTIEFESQDGVSIAGQSVIGAVCIELSDSTNVTGEWDTNRFHIWLHKCQSFCALVLLKLVKWKLSWGMNFLAFQWDPYTGQCSQMGGMAICLTVL